jgi:hypothetical protein
MSLLYQFNNLTRIFNSGFRSLIKKTWSSPEACMPLESDYENIFR